MAIVAMTPCLSADMHTLETKTHAERSQCRGAAIKHAPTPAKRQNCSQRSEFAPPQR